MLEVRNLNVYHGNIKVLKDLSFSVAEGELVAILGANGAGKSTLLGALAGLYPLQKGEIFFNGVPVMGRSADFLVRSGISLVPENRQIFASLSVKENLLLGAFHRYAKDKQHVYEDLEFMFELFPPLAKKKNEPAGNLSGGLQQMLAIGRGLMAAPKLLMLDEPSVGLAPLIVREIMAVLSHLKNSGKTIILVEQNARAALKVADRAWVMEMGKIVLSGTPSELSKSSHVKHAYLGQAKSQPNDQQRF